MVEPVVKRRRDSERTREAILDAARDVFIEHGYTGASIRRVADVAGCTHGTIYLYFRDKDDLLQQLSEEHFRQLLARLRALPHALDPVSRLREVAKTIVDYGIEFPNHYHLMVSLRPPHAVQGQQRRFGPMADEVYGLLFDAIERAAERGRIASDNRSLDTDAFFSAVHGVVELHRATESEPEETRAIADRLIGVLLDGLAPRRAVEQLPTKRRTGDSVDS